MGSQTFNFAPKFPRQMQNFQPQGKFSDRLKFRAGGAIASPGFSVTTLLLMEVEATSSRSVVEWLRVLTD